MKKLSIKELTKNKKKKGFTLIELIIVIAIIAILAAIAIPKFGEVRQSANIKTDVATAKNIATAAASMLADDPNSDPSGDIEGTHPIIDKMDGSVTPKAEGDKFTVSVNNGNITVSVDSKEVYPNTDPDYGK